MARVLIVDDEYSIRATLGAFVEQDGHTVHVACDAAEAIALMKAEQLDVVVTDILLPQKSGIALLDDVRELQPTTQVVMITGEPSISSASEAVRKGAFDYLSKPVSRDDITRAVTTAVNKKTLLDENRLLEAENLKHREHLEELVAERTKQLTDSEARYRTLFTSIADPVFVFGRETSFFLDCNEPALANYGYTMAELSLMTPADLHPPEDREIVRAILADQGDRAPRRSEHTTKNGETFPVEIHSAGLEYRGHPAWISIVRDISVRKDAEERTNRLLAQQLAINELTHALGNEQDLERIYFTIYEHVSRMMNASAFIISFYEAELEQFQAGFLVDEGEVIDVSHLPTIPLEKEGRGAQSQVIHTGSPVYLRDWHEAMRSTDARYTISENGTLAEGPPSARREVGLIQSGLLVPIRIDGAIIGVLQVQSRRMDAYTKLDEELLSGMANVAAIAIQNFRLHARALSDSAELRTAFTSAIEVLARATEARDPYTAGHQIRVAELASAIALELALPEDTAEFIRVSAMVHDIGKLAIPAELLSKSSALTAVEYRLIQGHVETAYDILKSVDFPWPVATVVWQHHERMDGSGYPRGLSGDALMIEARIIGVADVVEAMSSRRPYRPAPGIPAALDEIQSSAGARYDSDVVAACSRVFEAGFAFSDASQA